MIAHLTTLHFLTWVHCPPLIAEASDAAHAGSHLVSLYLPRPLPLTMVFKMREKSKSWEGTLGE